MDNIYKKKYLKYKSKYLQLKNSIGGADYNGAGSAFTDGKHILAAYQSLKKPPFISGLGGSKNPGETAFITAIRETFEELFEIYTIPSELIREIKEIKPKQIIKTGTDYIYINYIFTFDNLQEILLLCNKYNLVSKLYVTFPKNMSELIHNRIVDYTIEISHLGLVPVVENPDTLVIHKLFIDEIKLLE